VAFAAPGRAAGVSALGPRATCAPPGPAARPAPRPAPLRAPRGPYSRGISSDQEPAR
jgi:hypothetical protein